MNHGASTEDWSQKTWVWGSALLEEPGGSEQVALKTKPKNKTLSLRSPFPSGDNKQIYLLRRIM